MLRRLERVAEQVGSLEEDLKELTDGEVRALTPEFKERYAGGESLDDLLAKAYAAMRAAARRCPRHAPLRRTDQGGAASHFGDIAEMQTGEGKILVGTLPVNLNALTGKGFHLVTANDYLAERDAE
jgi:preprotein translocase subunit SecA